ncbi:uncharacterized protein EHS24_002626 [Apiotrichum porosum]|uniref:Uncharacterized protein n=1 Tax=Apiotrichum porosum TaxID=105984 RepID=A0A427XHD2_9TREE|nr:uncharacterized protein EHS24_002626 [Apiotrichum porosum]RSH78167.1 hypothetical protein EHS24_002626 [Apiotrichum porosum]
MVTLTPPSSNANTPTRPLASPPPPASPTDARMDVDTITSATSVAGENPTPPAGPGGNSSGSASSGPASPIGFDDAEVGDLGMGEGGSPQSSDTEVEVDEEEEALNVVPGATPAKATPKPSRKNKDQLYESDIVERWNVEIGDVFMPVAAPRPAPAPPTKG